MACALIIGYLIGDAEKETEMQDEAVAKGKGEYFTDHEGEKRFRWKE